MPNVVRLAILMLMAVSAAALPTAKVEANIKKDRSSVCDLQSCIDAEKQIIDLQQRLALVNHKTIDFADRDYFQEANEKLRTAPNETHSVVFLGDSITGFWGSTPAGFFPGKHYINRGVAGQTTSQMLLRFQQDVISIHPRVVVILGGINDLASGGDLDKTANLIESNITSMSQIAKFSHVTVILASLTPLGPKWSEDIRKAVVALNLWMKTFALMNGCIYLDYFSGLVDPKGAYRSDLTGDGLHPNDAGYRVMAAHADAALREALRTSN